MITIVVKIDKNMFNEPKKIEHIAKRLIEEKKRGRNVVAVVPSFDFMDETLHKLAYSLSNEPSKRELDVLLAANSTIASALLAIAISKRGFKSVSLSGWQIGLETTSEHGHVQVETVQSNVIMEHFKKGEIVIVAGGQGIDYNKTITILKDGGAEISAVAIAISIEANQLEVYTNQEGIYTADPNIVKNARKLEMVSYDELLELSYLGSQIINSEAVELAKKYEMPIIIRSSMEDTKGTMIRGVGQMEKIICVRGIAYETDIIRLTVGYESYDSSMLAELFTTLAKHQINVDIIVQAVIDGVNPTVSFSIEKEMFSKTIKVLEENKVNLGFSFADFEVGLAKVSIVGSGMVSNPGVAARMFQRLKIENIPVKMVSTSEIKVSVVVPQDDMVRAANALHDEFKLAEKQSS